MDLREKTYTLALCVAGFLGSASPANVQMPEKANVVLVATGEIGYNRGPIASTGFYPCSAVIFDFGDDALFAHAIPPLPYDAPTTADNVVAMLMYEARVRKLSLARAEAIVNAGTRTDLGRIITDLEENKIFVRDAELGLQGRDLLYDPGDDTLTETPTNAEMMIF